MNSMFNQEEQTDKKKTAEERAYSDYSKIRKAAILKKAIEEIKKSKENNSLDKK